MRATKLLSVMAMAACFAACTKEVLVEPEKAIDSFDEVKGAKMIASGFSINPNATDAQTKITVEDGKGGWSEGDVAGVAWFVNGIENITEDQGSVVLGDITPTAFANHKLVYDGGRFESRSNVYEGWHVSYYPYKEMTKPSALSDVTVNKVMSSTLTDKKSYEYDKYMNAPLFSGAYKLGEGDVEEGVIKTEMPLAFVVNSLRPKFEVVGITGETLNNLTVTSIELSAGDKKIFANTLRVNPAKFPDGTEESPDEEFPVFTNTHYGEAGATISKSPALSTTEYKTSVETTLDQTTQSAYTLGAGQLNFRIFMIPVPDVDVVMEDLSVKVNLSDDSYFLLSGEEYALEATAETKSVNYNAFKKLVDLFSAEGWKDPNGNAHSLRNLDKDNFSLDFELIGDDYQTTYTVKTIEDWNNNIKLATEAGKTEVTFNLADDADVVFPTGDMGVPEGLKVTVTAPAVKHMTFAGETTWSPNVTMAGKASVKVAETGVLTVNQRFTPENITNNGNIVVNNGSTIGGSNGIDNYGTIEVSCGTVLTNCVDKAEGKVIYKVKGLAAETADVISALIAKAGLDLLEVNENLTLTSAAPLNWNTVNVEMNGATITSNAKVTANAWNVKAGENTITGDIEGPVIVAAGATLTVTGDITGDVTVAADATLTVNGDINGNVAVNGALTVVGNVTGNVTVAAGATLDATNISGVLANKGTVTVESDEFVKIGEIHNEGALETVGANVYVSVITTKPNSTTTVDENYVIYYTGSYTNGGGVTEGKILKATEDNGYVSNADYDKIDGTYFVKTDAGFKTVMTQDVKEINAVLNESVAIAGDADQFVFGGATTEKVTINANGNTITFEQGSATDDALNYISTANNVELVIENAKINKTGAANKDQFVHNLKFACPVTLKNVVSDKAFNVMSDATFENVTIKDAADVYAIWIQPLGQTVQLKGTNLIEGSRGIKIEKSRANGEVKKTYLNVDGTTFKTTKKAAVLVNTSAGAVITWGVNNIEAVAVDDENAVWVDEDCPTVDYLKVEVNGCTKIPEPTL